MIEPIMPWGEFGRDWPFPNSLSRCINGNNRNCCPAFPTNAGSAFRRCPIGFDCTCRSGICHPAMIPTPFIIVFIIGNSLPAATFRTTTRTMQPQTPTPTTAGSPLSLSRKKSPRPRRTERRRSLHPWCWTVIRGARSFLSNNPTFFLLLLLSTTIQTITTDTTTTRTTCFSTARNSTPPRLAYGMNAAIYKRPSPNRTCFMIIHHQRQQRQQRMAVGQLLGNNSNSNNEFHPCCGALPTAPVCSIFPTFALSATPWHHPI
mmetsp:Transcript_27869/g.76709  ORF Transcript_27869/g.76709 Transcript_27869/m.76709 type:complete len:261 (-) Transcript_27869:60-842(-)